MDWLLLGFAKRKSLAIERYIEFVKAGKNKSSPWGELTNQVFLSSENFVNKVRTHIPENQDLSKIVIAQKRSVVKSLEYYRQNSDDRNSAICLAFSSGGYTMKELGEYFELHYSRISRAVADAARNKTCPFTFADIEEARKAMEENYAGCYKSLADFAEELTEETSQIPEHLRYYIDYEKMGRDMEMSGDV